MLSPKSTSKDGAIFLFSAVILLSAIYLNGRALLASLYGPSAPPPDSYTYLDADFPPTLLPLSEHPYAARMIIDDTAHYAPNASDSAEWHALFPPGSEGFVRLGPDHRLFGVSMFHQLHCLMRLQKAVYEPPQGRFNKYHASHCMNYLREMFLCAANVRLEPFRFDPQVGQDKVDGLGLEHTCRDWSTLRGIVEENYGGWPKGMD